MFHNFGTLSNQYLVLCFVLARYKTLANTFFTSSGIHISGLVSGADGRDNNKPKSCDPPESVDNNNNNNIDNLK